VDLILQGHGQPCEKAKLDGDIRYVENLRAIVREESESGKGLDEVKSLTIDRFADPDRLEGLPDLYKERIHKSNLERAFSELTESRI